MKPGVGVPVRLRACLRDAHWPEWAALGTRIKRREEGLGLRQRVKVRGARSLAGSWARGRLVGSGRGSALYAPQVLDTVSACRARSSAVGRNSTKSYRAREGSSRFRGGQWRGGSEKGTGFENLPCPCWPTVILVMERVEAWDWAMEAVERMT
jgi:hypothetical protein